MKTIVLSLCTLALGASLTYAQSPQAKPEVRQLTLQPRALADTPLTRRLLPSAHEFTRGNAAPVYLSGMLMIASQPKEWHDQLAEYRDVKIDQLPREKVRQFLPEHILRQFHLAARREHCAWDHTAREEGFDAVLPHLNHIRTAARLLSLDIRLAIREQRWDDATRSLQTGMAMARHLEQEAVLIEGLVASAIAGVMLDDLQLLIQQPDAPNLYWPLAILKRPMLDFGEMMERERAMILHAYPALREMQRGSVDEPSMRAVLLLLAHADKDPQELDMQQFEQELKQLYQMLLPHGKAHLAQQGVPNEQIEAMPPQQVVMQYMLDDFWRWYDRLTRWYHVPLWQRYPGLLEAETELQQASAERPNPLRHLMPSTVRASWTIAKPDRYVAALQTIEAVRAHAAAHDGKLPDALSDIEIPVPMDPVTGQPMRYQRTESGFTLTSPSSTGDLRDELHYEVTMK